MSRRVENLRSVGLEQLGGGGNVLVTHRTAAGRLRHHAPEHKPTHCRRRGLQLCDIDAVLIPGTFDGSRQHFVRDDPIRVPRVAGYSCFISKSVDDRRIESRRNQRQQFRADAVTRNADVGIRGVLTPGYPAIPEVELDIGAIAV